MTKSPYINALGAAVYIALVGTFMFYAPKFAPPGDTLAVPIAMISLFTLSAAVMGYVFLAQPIQLYLEGKKQAAVNLFLRTLLVFAALTLLFLAVALSGALAK